MTRTELIERIDALCGEITTEGVEFRLARKVLVTLSGALAENQHDGFVELGKACDIFVRSRYAIKTGQWKLIHSGNKEIVS